ncbi:MAG: DUF5114 domain-containing protein [Dysgonamonadaceae bacterium]
MKIKYRFIQFLTGIIASLMAMTSCSTDWDKMFLSSLESNKLTATESNVVLSKETSKQIVMTLVWSNQTIAISNPDVSIPNTLTNFIQASTTEDFSSNVQETQVTTYSHPYTGADLNTLAKNLSLKADTVNNVYFRLKARLGANMEAVYSNVATVAITPYSIDMTIGHVLDSKKSVTATTLASLNADGVYKGFMGVTAWYNFFLQEGDGTTWGNNATTGTAFEASSADGSWNFWFPGQSGCYYTIVNTVKKQWSALLLPSLTASGDIAGDMTFNRDSLQWTLTFTAKAAGTATLKMNTTGLQYDYATGTDDTKAVSTPVGFVQDGSNVDFASSAGNITVTIPKAGECTLVLNLKNPKAWTCSVKAGSSTQNTVSQYLYVPGVDDGISGSWTFNNYLRLYDDSNLNYAGVIQVNSQWGYTFNPTKDDWNDKYTMAGGDAYSGTLAYQGNTNLSAPTAGLYLFNVSLKGLTYSLTALSNQIYAAGLNDDWSFNTPLTETSTIGVYSGQVTISKASSWGFKIYPVKDNWDLVFGGSKGTLYYKGNGITDDASLSAGTYTLAVNLVAGTYSISK